MFVAPLRYPLSSCMRVRDWISHFAINRWSSQVPCCRVGIREIYYEIMLSFWMRSDCVWAALTLWWVIVEISGHYHILYCQCLILYRVCIRIQYFGKAKKWKKGFFTFSFVLCLYGLVKCVRYFCLVLLTTEKYIRECVYCFFFLPVFILYRSL